MRRNVELKKDAKRIFKFKDEKYSVYDLLLFYIDKRLKDFKEGEVENLVDGEVFSITDIKSKLYLLNEEIINNAEHLSYSERSKLRGLLSEDENNKRKEELNNKLENSDIDIEELKELMFLEGDSFGEGYIDFSLIEKDYIKINQATLFPQDIKDNTLGKFLKLLMLTTYQNNIQKTNRGNSGNMSKSELKKYLKISNDKTFSTTFQELEKYDLLFRKQKPGKGFIIFINPLYANRNNKFHLDKTQYKLFKDNLKDKLPKRMCVYLDMMNNESNCALEIDVD
jgi:hypothetical protein